MNRRSFMQVCLALITGLFAGRKVKEGNTPVKMWIGRTDGQWGFAVGDDLAKGKITWASRERVSIGPNGEIILSPVFMRDDIQADVFVADEVRPTPGTDTMAITKNGAYMLDQQHNVVSS